MKKPHKTLRALGFGRSVIKYNAHATTLLAVFLSFPCGTVIYFILTAPEPRPAFVATPENIILLCLPLLLVGIYIWSIVAAIYYWCTERKRKVTILKTGGEVDC